MKKQLLLAKQIFMQFPKPITLQYIATLIEAEVIGDAYALALGINEIHQAKEGDLVFVDHPKYYQKCLDSIANHIIINSKDIPDANGKNLLYCADPFEAYLKIADHFRPFSVPQKSISDDVQIGEGTQIMPNVFIGRHVKIGKNCTVYPNVVLMDYTEIGNDVVIQSGTVIGSDAFYYNTKKNREVWYKKMQSVGHVVIENNVEIGANCTVDRGVTAITLIGAGSKLDNLVHIGHDTIIGKNCLIAAQVGIAGATVIEDGVTLWGQVGVTKTITIGANAVVLAQSGVSGSLKGDKVYFGYPAQDASEKRRELVWVKRIPELWKKVFEK